MNNKKKVEIFDRIYELVKEETEPTKTLQCIGTLNKPWGMNGHIRCEIGHPVYEKGDRYVLYMDSTDGKNTLEVPFYKEDLCKIIDINKVVEVNV